MAFFRGPASNLVRRVIKAHSARIAAARLKNSGHVFNAGKVIDKAYNPVGFMGDLVSRKALAVPALLGIAGAGFAVGFTKEVSRNPTTNAMISDYLSINSEDQTGAPLGITPEQYIYRPPRNDLAATGELALALFKTRHGR